MQAKKLLLGAMCAAFFGVVGCTGLEPYTINAPEDLADKIAEYKAEKEARNQGDTVLVDITHAMVGAEDNSTGWWGDWSQSFEIPAGRLLHLEFINYGAKVETWNNWNLVFATTLGHSTGDNPDYAERLVLRADHFGWGAGWDIALDKNYIDDVELADYGDAFWADFKEKMDGAYVVMEIDRSPLGVTFITVEAQAKDGSIVSKTYNFPLNDSIIYAFLTTDSSHFDMQKAYLINSKITEIAEVQPASISITGFPASVSQGTTLEEVLEGATLAAKVTYEDGTSGDIALEDVAFSVSETFASVPGEDVILYTYNKTKSGAVASTPVAGFTKVTITTELESITASAKAYVVGNGKYITLSPSAISVTGVYSGGSTLPISSSDCTVSFTEDKVVYDAVPGTYANAFTVTYGSGADAMTTTGDLVIAASSLPAQEENVGAKDFSNGWWSTFTRDWVVAPGESQTIGFTLYSKGAANFQSPCTILRRADLSEYGVVRMDHWCWGAATGDTDPASANYPARIDITSNWNFEGTYFAEHLNGSTVNITVANDGTYASISYYVIYPDGEETHFQRYDKIPVDANDVQFALVTEASYLEFVADAPIDPSDPTITGISAEAKAYVIGNAGFVTLSPLAVKVTAAMSDNTTKELDRNSCTIVIDKPVFAATVGTVEDAYEVKYTDAANNVFTCKGTLTIAVSEQEKQAAGQVGDIAKGFVDGGWSKEWTVAPYESQTIAYTIGGTRGQNNWDCPILELRGMASPYDYYTLRLDNAGWWNGGTSWGNPDVIGCSCDWNFEGTDFKDNMPNAKVCITVTNGGEGYADARLNVTYANETTHYQYYERLAVDKGATLRYTVAADFSYLIFE